MFGGSLTSKVCQHHRNVGWVGIRLGNLARLYLRYRFRSFRRSCRSEIWPQWLAAQSQWRGYVRRLLVEPWASECTTVFHAQACLIKLRHHVCQTCWLMSQLISSRSILLTRRAVFLLQYGGITRRTGHLRRRPSHERQGRELNRKCTDSRQPETRFLVCVRVGLLPGR